MKIQEALVTAASEYYLNVPSVPGRTMFFYPTQLGHFYYEPGYCLNEDGVSGYLMMYLISGGLRFCYHGRNYKVAQNRFILIDCRQSHSFQADQPCEALWIRFDGPLAQPFYQGIATRLSNVFSITDSSLPFKRMNDVFFEFTKKKPVSEPYVSKLLNDVLTYFLLQPPVEERVKENVDAITNVINYIRERFQDKLTNDVLASYASMSPWHFIRIFKKETGMTPHQYVINTRFQVACYLLKNTYLPTKEICFQTGFSSESIFCTAFKRHTGMSPSEFRENGSIGTMA